MNPTSAPPSLEAIEKDIDQHRADLARLRESVARAFLGNAAVLDELLLCLIAGGHALLEGAPGLGKTTLVRALASSLDLSFQRVQFTPDLMPGDVLGARILEEDAAGRRTFRFLRGPIFAHLLLADEINRATPRTQAALLEAMQERQVTAFGETLALPQPFAVVATQNPIEMEGTYPLPEAQLDRFLAKIEVAAPPEEELVAILQVSSGPERALPQACLTRERLVSLCALVRQVPIPSDVVRLVARLVLATDPRAEQSPELVRTLVRCGASPRGGQALLLLAKARALVRGRLHASEEDVAAVARPALRHRLVPSYEGEASGVHPDRIVDAALERARR